MVSTNTLLRDAVIGEGHLLKKALILLLGLPAGMSSINAAQAQGNVLMTPIPQDSHARPQIVGGKPAKREDWPVTLLFEFAGSHCTSTVIGDRVVVTAAHCVDDEIDGKASKTNAKAVLANTMIDLKCYQHPRYRGSICNNVESSEKIIGCTADVALCLAIAGSIPESAGKFERVRASLPGPEANDKIVLLGFGCTVAGGALSPDLQIGDPDPVVEWTSTPGASIDPKQTYKEYIKVHGAAAACKGDSGGSSYTSSDLGTKEIVGITSRGNMSTDSYLVNVLDTHIVDFFKDFASKYGVTICGLDQKAKNCRF